MSAIGTAQTLLASGAQNSAAGISGLAQAFSALTPKQIQNCTALKGLSVQQIAAIANATDLAQAEKDQLASALSAAAGISTDAAANTADAAAKGVNEAATWSLSKAVKGLWAIMKAHPYAVITAAIGVVLFAATKLFNFLDSKYALTLEAQQEKTAALAEEYTTFEQEAQSVEDQLSDVRDRIEELNKLDNPTFSDEKELERLRKQNELLEQQLQNKRQLAAEKAGEVNESLAAEYQKSMQHGGYSSLYNYYDGYGGQRYAGAVSGEEYIQELIRKRMELNAIPISSWTQDDQDMLEFVDKELEKMAATMSDFALRVEDAEGNGRELYNTYYDTFLMIKRVLSGEYSLGPANKIGDLLGQERFSAAKSSLAALGSQGKITAQTLNDPAYKDFVDTLYRTGMVGDEAGVAISDVARYLNELFSKAQTSSDGVSSLKEALAGLSDETTVLRDAMAKLGEGSAAFDQWIGNSENLKALLDKFPDLRDELEAYATALAAGGDQQEAFITLQQAMNAALQDFNTDQIYEGVNDVAEAFNNYGAGSNRVLQAVQNLEKHVPGLTASLYDEDGALTSAGIAAVSNANALYDAAIATLELQKKANNVDLGKLIGQFDAATEAAIANKIAMANSFGDYGPDAVEWARGTILSAIDDSIAEFRSAKAKYGRSGSGARSGAGKTKSTQEVYVPDVDPLYQYLQTVEDINDELDRFDIDEKFLDENDFEGKNALIEKRIEKLEELKTALHELNNARDVEITAAVGKLNGYGDFHATYDAESGQALINNMDALKGLTGDTAKAAEELISTIESGSKDAIATSQEYMNTQVEINDLLKEQIENNQKLQEQAADDRIERLKNQISLSENQQGVEDDNLSRQGAVQKLKEQIGNLEEIQRIAHEAAEEVREEYRRIHNGEEMRNDDPLLQKWIREYWDAADKIKAKRLEIADAALAPIDEYIEKADEFNWWDNVDTSKVEMLAKQLELVNQLLEDGYLTAEQFKERNDKYAKEMYQAQADALDTIIDKTKEMIKLEAEKRIEALESEVEDHEKITNSIKERLAALREENGYNKSVAQKTKEIAELQQRINTLSLSNDRRDIAERKKLEEELAGLKSDLVDAQADHAYDTQVDALDKSHEAFEQSKQNEINVVKATIDTEGKLYALAIKRIDEDWDQLYKDLIRINDLYQSGIDGKDSITSAWENATAALQKYQGVLQAKQGIEKEYTTNIGNSNRVVSSQVNNPSATSHSLGTKAVDRYGMTVDQQEKLSTIAAEMCKNSLRWHSSDTEGKRRLEDVNRKKAAKAQSILEKSSNGVPHKLVLGTDGCWYIDKVGGDKFYEQYHTGTKSVGSNEPWDLKSDEIMAKLQRNEAVIPKDQVKPTIKLLEWGNTLASKMRGVFSGDGFVSYSMDNIIKGAPPSPAATAIVNNNGISVGEIKVEVQATHGVGNEEAMEQGRAVGRGVLEEISKAFSAKGLNRFSPATVLP